MVWSNELQVLTVNRPFNQKKISNQPLISTFRDLIYSRLGWTTQQPSFTKEKKKRMTLRHHLCWFFTIKNCRILFWTNFLPSLSKFSSSSNKGQKYWCTWHHLLNQDNVNSQARGLPDMTISSVFQRSSLNLNRFAKMSEKYPLLNLILHFLKRLVVILKPLVSVFPEIVKYGDTPAWELKYLCTG